MAMLGDISTCGLAFTCGPDRKTPIHRCWKRLRRKWSSWCGIQQGRGPIAKLKFTFIKPLKSISKRPPPCGKQSQNPGDEMATQKVRAKPLGRLYKTTRGQKKALGGASAMCGDIRWEFNQGNGPPDGIKLFDGTVPGEFALCSLCARFFATATAQESAKVLRTARVETKKKRQQKVFNSASAPPPFYTLWNKP